MGKKGPKRGSRSYWHRRRSERMSPIIHSWNTESKGLSGFAGYKAGMTTVMMVDDSTTPFAGQQIHTAATVIEVPPMFVYAINAYSTTAYGRKIIGTATATGAPKQLSRSATVAKKPKITLDQLLAKPEITHIRVVAFTQPWKAGIAKKTPESMEIGLGGSIEEQKAEAKNLLGKEVKASDALKNGEFLDIISVTTGRGWQGIVKRMNVSLNSHKATNSRRHGGSIGGERQAKVMYTIPRAGQTGFHRRTERNKRVLAITDSKALAKSFEDYGTTKSDVLVLRGSVGGPCKRLIRLRKTTSKRASQGKEPQVKLQVI